MGNFLPGLNNILRDTFCLVWKLYLQETFCLVWIIYWWDTFLTGLNNLLAGHILTGLKNLFTGHFWLVWIIYLRDTFCLVWIIYWRATFCLVCIIYWRDTLCLVRIICWQDKIFTSLLSISQLIFLFVFVIYKLNIFSYTKSWLRTFLCSLEPCFRKEYFNNVQ